MTAPRGDNAMTCADLEAMLCDYVDGTLDEARAAVVRRHLDSCAACGELAADAARAVAFLERVAPVEPPDPLVTRLLFQVSTSRQLPPKRGARGWLARWLQPALQPRFAMGMAMTILSISLLARSIGLPDRTLKPADLRPSAVIAALEDRLHRAWDSVVKYYENLRVVYEIRNRLSEWSSEQEAETPEEEARPPGGLPRREDPEAGKRSERR